MMKPVSLERLREVARYCPETGVFIRRVKVAKNDVVGVAMGGYRADGYLRISIDGGRYYGHHLAWLYMTGEWPDHEIDHRDRHPSNNRWKNLRAATSSQNKANAGLRSDNTSGVRGVSWDAARGKWSVKISIGSRSKNLGRYLELEDAIAARMAAVKTHFGDFASA